MRRMPRTVVWFNEVTKKDISFAGGKGANLGELTNANIPVPPGFIVTSGAYFDFIEKSGLAEKIRDLLQPLDVGDSKQLQQVAGQIRDVILGASMPAESVKEIKKAYQEMGRGLVAVRSSATAEDLPEASFAGQQRTFLNIQGEQELLEAVQECWASLFAPRAIFYRQEQGFDHMEVGIAVPVQRMVQSKVSGVMFTVDPMTSDTDKIVVEAIYGLGEAIVSGEVTPDLYMLDKEKLTIDNKRVGRQEWKLVRNTAAKGKDANIKLRLEPDVQVQQKLPDEDIVVLAKLGKQIEALYKFPQDVEWAKEDGKLFVVQTRPVTTIKEKSSIKVTPEIQAPVLLSGAAASPGTGTGPATIIEDASDIDKVGKGDVLVAPITTPDFVPAMKRAVAIITERGGSTSHAAIVSRELGVPCVVGAEQATTVLTDGQLVTVDGSRGKVYNGKVAGKVFSAEAEAAKEAIPTKTKVYVNLAQPELAEAVAARNVDGVGLLRAEFMIAQIGEHPRYMISQKREGEFVEKLANGINIFAKAFNPRPVVYRVTDFKSNEYRDLVGGQEYEVVEANPMLGYRGASRHTRELDVFGLEIEAIKKVRRQYRNLWVMIPFVRTIQELVEIKKFLESRGLKSSDDFKLWMMVEVPSNILLMEKFIDVGIDGISIGSNDLTQLILGIDRDSHQLEKEFDERNEAVLVALERAITVSRKMGITSSICGQAPSFYPDLTERLVKWGITSVSVSPDMIGTTRAIIAKAEARLKSG